MYRAVTLYALENGMISDDGVVDNEAVIKAIPNIKIDFKPCEDGMQHTLLNGNDVENEIRQLRVSNVVSPVSAIAEVRHALVDMQQALGKAKGIVMDGRDIGTTVFPDAELKIFVDASAQTRAQRRFSELIAKGSNVTFEEVLANVVHRDAIDRSRAESPLRKADDAIALDNSTMSIEEQDKWLMEKYKEVINK
jgi:cytidylate kinase